MQSTSNVDQTQMCHCFFFFFLSLCVCAHHSDECVPLGCMVVHSVARLCPLLQPVSLFSLPNAPSLADLEWDEDSAQSGNINFSPAIIMHKLQCVICSYVCLCLLICEGRSLTY